jgi:rhodanese-related sulfurtransferase
MALKKGIKVLLEEANAKIRTLSVSEAMAAFGDEKVVFVDIRDVRELETEGQVPSAFHAPRGMLEFWVDPDSPYYKPIFGSGKEFILYCRSGWRSALTTAALVDMGFGPVAHVEGGYTAWKNAGCPTGPREHHKHGEEKKK